MGEANALERKVADEIKSLLSSNPTDADFLLVAKYVIATVAYHRFQEAAAAHKRRAS